MDPSFLPSEWAIEPGTNRFIREVDAEACEVRVEPKVMQVLQALASRPGETLTKQELFERVRGGRRLTDDVLMVTVSALRKALGTRLGLRASCRRCRARAIA